MKTLRTLAKGWLLTVGVLVALGLVAIVIAIIVDMFTSGIWPVGVILIAVFVTEGAFIILVQDVHSDPPMDSSGRTPKGFDSVYPFRRL